MWEPMPDPDGLDATWGNVWWLFVQTLRCAVRGHGGTEYLPGWPGDKRWRACRHCGCSRMLVEQPAGSPDQGSGDGGAG